MGGGGGIRDLVLGVDEGTLTDTNFFSLLMQKLVLKCSV